MSRSNNPSPSSYAALRRMKSVKRRDTAPEVALRSILFRKGLRYRIDRQPIAGLKRRADILFSSAKVAVFIDGCFWHGCPIHGTQAKANAEFWNSKIKNNKERDKDTNSKLEKAGWKVIRIWEHEDPEQAAQIIAEEVNNRLKKN